MHVKKAMVKFVHHTRCINQTVDKDQSEDGTDVYRNLRGWYTGGTANQQKHLKGDGLSWKPVRERCGPMEIREAFSSHQEKKISLISGFPIWLRSNNTCIALKFLH